MFVLAAPDEDEADPEGQLEGAVGEAGLGSVLCMLRPQFAQHHARAQEPPWDSAQTNRERGFTTVTFRGLRGAHFK